MKICIDAHSLGDKSGGNETYYRNIIDNIHFFLDRKDKLIILVKSKNEAEKIQERQFENVEVVVFKSRNPIIRYLFEIPKLIKKYKIDVLHTQYYAPIIKNCRLIVSIHDISYIHYPEYFSRMEFIRNKIWIKYTVRKADAILTISEFSKQDIIKQYNINKEKIYVTPLASGNAFKKMTEQEVFEVRQRFDIDDKYILSVGNLQPRKNLISLVKAYMKLRDNNKDIKIKLVIVGKKAWKSDKIFSAINSSNILDEIVLTDYVTEKELVALYNGAEFFIYPSVFEGFGLPIVEAMSCGTPVIVSNKTSMPEVAGDAAIYINPYDINDISEKMQLYLGDKLLRDGYKAKGLIKSQEFSWKKTCKMIMDLYKNINKIDD